MESIKNLISGNLLKIIALVVFLGAAYFVYDWNKNRTVTSETTMSSQSPAELPPVTEKIPTQYGAVVTEQIKKEDDSVISQGIPKREGKLAAEVDSIVKSGVVSKVTTGSNTNTKTIQIETAKFSIPKKGFISSLFMKTYKGKTSPSSSLIFQSLDTSGECQLLGYLPDNTEIFAKGKVESTELGYIMYIPKAMHSMVNGKDAKFFLGDGETLVRVSMNFLEFEPIRGYKTLISIRK